MGNLIVVVGSTGVGKTSLVQVLCRQMDLQPALEEHAGRPFQQLFKSDPGYAFPNQIDFLLRRAEQEQALRAGPRTGIQDGGLEMDFFGFTQLFRARGWLSEDEFATCERFYHVVRSLLPPPDLVIALSARPEVVARRLGQRERVNIASAQDGSALEAALERWLAGLDPACLVRLDSSDEDREFGHSLPGLLEMIEKRFGSST